jgi:cytochrome c oxidase subunit 4
MDSAVSEHAADTPHASIRTYLLIAVILTVVTALEVGTYFTPWFKAHFWVLFWVLVVLSLFKFALVVGFYMHLRYDSPLYRRVFIFPLAIAIAMTVVVIFLTATKFRFLT